MNTTLDDLGVAKRPARRPHRVVHLLLCAGLLATGIAGVVLLVLYLAEPATATSSDGPLMRYLESAGPFSGQLYYFLPVGFNGSVAANASGSLFATGHSNFDYDINMTQGATVQRYTMVSGALYVSVIEGASQVSVTCGSASTLPSMASVVAAIQTATQSNDVSACDAGYIAYATTFLGAPMTICQSIELGTSSGRDLGGITLLVLAITKAISPTLVVALARNTSMTPPVPPRQSLACPALSEALVANTTKSPCACRSGRRPCLFFHGAGVANESSSLLASYAAYWGNDLVDAAPCCSSLQFARFDTTTVPWTSSVLQQKFCASMLSVANTTGSVGRLIVVTHSMGGLVLGLALANGVCSFSAETKWVALHTPMAGSPVLNMLLKSCAIPSLSSVLGLLGRCPIAPTFAYMYEAGSWEATALGLNSYYTRAQGSYKRYADAVLCGQSPVGLWTSASGIMTAINALAAPSTPHDGLSGQTALIAAARGGHASVVRLLLAPIIEGMTAKTMALEKKHVAVAEVLDLAENLVQAVTTADLASVLMLAVRHGHTQLLQMLLRRPDVPSVDCNKVRQFALCIRFLMHA
ncbi:hypothetical protein SDRG_06204 [Saprolegnia diclina VS20]|uniref:Uncharacterized protein n=1 Tax=Saprolegnia diclina (strain VS20) TaxID=1156394 RepID=T0QQC7_SAPDV|nr:hypothetical protein SDRG_06204 [Saprolegnia diclina VS20]EQC36085.1 hypothetical protein SDRG_06204 [Saprolegnia diclina VS20]|eukprot:XP_008610191.1 hypothetical protein SDRG_06204 [Saprolegnia diclina VS20]